MTFPDFIVHYNRSEPFRSISEVPPDDLQKVLGQLNETNSWGLNRFSDPEYLPQRVRVEQKLREEFIVKGGKPTLKYPIYFFLGRNSRFEEHRSNIGYSIKLENVSPEVVSFTYGDSMFSMCDNYRQKLGNEYLSHLCSQVYRRADLNDLFTEINAMPQKLHIECQLWKRPDPSLVTRIA